MAVIYRHMTEGDITGSSLREEPVSSYSHGGMPSATDHWIAVLGDFGVKALPRAGGPLAQVREALHQGLPRKAFDGLRDELGVTTDDLADVLGIPSRTLARRTDRFKPDESERLLRLGSVLRKATDVLEEPESVRRWMLQPKRALGGLTPLRCCDTEVGAREVEALLTRIEHGVFS
jgi:putative toxin-antitoxin system antitoxin component (TIGR02293 family)